MSNSSLVCYKKLSPNCTKMSNKINKKITIVIYRNFYYFFI